MKPNLNVIGKIVSIIGLTLVGFVVILGLNHIYVPAELILIGWILNFIGLVLTIKYEETKQPPA
jgi:hypothetical protein